MRQNSLLLLLVSALLWKQSTAFSARKIIPSTNFPSSVATRRTALWATFAAKEALLDSLDDPRALNRATKERTQLVGALTKTNATPRPGSTAGFAPIAVGTWRIVYAPHISNMASLVGGRSFDPVYYILKQGGAMTSHARFNVPLIASGWLSVSGTYGSEDDDRICRVDFDKAWVTLDKSASNKNTTPVPSLEEVPDSLSKTIVQTLGQLGFVKSVSLFPVSYLDTDTIVFDFELLGTRICARKVGSVDHIIS